MEHNRENARVGFEDRTMTARPTDEEIAELRERVRLFNRMGLPGQPMGMHMGTLYLVNDLAALLALVTQEGGDSHTHVDKDVASNKYSPARSSDAPERATSEENPLPEGMETTRLTAKLEIIRQMRGKTILGPFHDRELNMAHEEGAAKAFEQAADAADNLASDIDRALAEIARLTAERAAANCPEVARTPESEERAATIRSRSTP